MKPRLESPSDCGQDEDGNEDGSMGNQDVSGKELQNKIVSNFKSLLGKALSSLTSPAPPSQAQPFVSSSAGPSTITTQVSLVSATQPSEILLTDMANDNSITITVNNVACAITSCRKTLTDGVKLFPMPWIDESLRMSWLRQFKLLYLVETVNGVPVTGPEDLKDIAVCSDHVKSRVARQLIRRSQVAPIMNDDACAVIDCACTSKDVVEFHPIPWWNQGLCREWLCKSGLQYLLGQTLDSLKKYKVGKASGRKQDLFQTNIRRLGLLGFALNPNLNNSESLHCSPLTSRFVAITSRGIVMMKAAP